MKNKLTFLTIFLLVIATIFTGCDLSFFSSIERNSARYLNQTVAKTSTGISISMEKLTNAFSNYGYENFEVNSELTRQEAVVKTLDLLIDREIALAYAKENLTLSNSEINDAWREAFNAVNDALKSFETEILTEKNIDNNYGTDENTKIPSGTVKEVYEPRANVVNGVIEVLPHTHKKEDFIIATKENCLEIFESGYAYFSTESTSAEARNRLYKQLKENEKGKNLSTVNEEVLKREIVRIYEVQEENAYLHALEDDFNKTNQITEAMVLEKYRNLVKSQAATYNFDVEKYYSAINNNDTAKDVYYVPRSTQDKPVEQFYYVSHILLSFSDAQKAQAENYKKLYNAKIISKETYDANMNTLYGQIRVQEVDEEGFAHGVYKSPGTILQEINYELKKFNSLNGKAQAFNSFIYKYNSDPGIFNAEINYIVGAETSSMVEPFTEASRELFKGAEGGVSGLVRTEHGIHIIMYTGKVKNILPIQDIGNITLEKLASTRLQPGESKTMFDKIYDSLYSQFTTNAFGQYQTNLINTIKETQNIKITKYKNVYTQIK